MRPRPRAARAIAVSPCASSVPAAVPRRARTLQPRSLLLLVAVPPNAIWARSSPWHTIPSPARAASHGRLCSGDSVHCRPLPARRPLACEQALCAHANVCWAPACNLEERERERGLHLLSLSHSAWPCSEVTCFAATTCVRTERLLRAARPCMRCPARSVSCESASHPGIACFSLPARAASEQALSLLVIFAGRCTLSWERLVCMSESVELAAPVGSATRCCAGLPVTCSRSSPRRAGTRCAAPARLRSMPACTMRPVALFGRYGRVFCPIIGVICA